VLSICSPQSHGRAGGEWMGAGCAGEHATDQRLDDGGALVFETDVLDAPLSVLGTVRAHLRLSADQPVAHCVLRLSDVAPDGAATRVTYQVFNLTHRHSHENPSRWCRARPSTWRSTSMSAAIASPPGTGCALRWRRPIGR
jgi:predicted acyl esterase